MDVQTQTIEAIQRFVRVYDRGIICPAELWFKLTMSTTEDNALVTLNSLPVETQNRLREIYLDRPASLEGIAEEHPRVGAIFLKWVTFSK
jgi:hypothetical protein